ncbi:hypothetical protein Tco_0747638 [Tanacetum coccineum]|uniref:Uncharacterized protein n=1 Tax=Tanacetum coccineum TaxID=301880 RepID=A0ABQ4YW22_9ASTR
MIETIGTSIIITPTRLNLKSRSIKDQNSRAVAKALLNSLSSNFSSGSEAKNDIFQSKSNSPHASPTREASDADSNYVSRKAAKSSLLDEFTDASSATLILKIQLYFLEHEMAIEMSAD